MIGCGAGIRECELDGCLFVLKGADPFLNKVCNDRGIAAVADGITAEVCEAGAAFEISSARSCAA